jgi:hypothetical protein
VGTDSTAIVAVAISALDTSIIYSTTPSFFDAFGQLRRSRDGGITWERINTPGSAEVSNFAINPYAPAAIWIITIDESTYVSEVFFSNDGGRTWNPVNDGLPRTEIRNIVIASSQRLSLFALTNTSGLYRLDYSTAVESGMDNLPGEFQLFQNYPNPFWAPSGRESRTNPHGSTFGTVIEYRLASENLVELRIYDLLGKVVATLVSQKQGAGNYRVYWDGKDSIGQSLPAGIYFMKLTTSHASRIRKIVLLH